MMIFGVIYKLVLVREIGKLREGLVGGLGFMSAQPHIKSYK